MYNEIHIKDLKPKKYTTFEKVNNSIIFENGKANTPHKLVLNLSNNNDLRRLHKRISFSNLSIYCREILKRLRKLMISKSWHQCGMKNLDYLVEHI